ncbi:uncharacterized protein DMENIID0001_151890 [Sergentomyia squamirostris]
MDRLVPIPREELPVLRDLYKVDWPKHLVVYKTINHYILWLEINPNIENLHIWSLSGSWRTNGTVIIKNNFDIHFSTLEDNSESLVRAFCLVDWRPGFLICALMENQRKSVWKAIGKANIPMSAKYNQCFGAYSSNNDLIGWIFITTSGAIGTLHVIEEYRGRKIAQALVVKLCQYIEQSLQLDLHVFITHENIPSQKLFKKLGFIENTEQGYWILTKPFNTT